VGDPTTAPDALSHVDRVDVLTSGHEARAGLGDAFTAPKAWSVVTEVLFALGYRTCDLVHATMGVGEVLGAEDHLAVVLGSATNSQRTVLTIVDLVPVAVLVRNEEDGHTEPRLRTNTVHRVTGISGFGPESTIRGEEVLTDSDISQSKTPIADVCVYTSEGLNLAVFVVVKQDPLLLVAGEVHAREANRQTITFVDHHGGSFSRHVQQAPALRGFRWQSLL